MFRLARGGMGSVYAAVLAGAHGVERTVAIKLLNSNDKTPEDVAAFVQEAKVTARLSHPNVLETFELGMDAGEPFIVMPLVRGVSLSKLVGRMRSAGTLLEPAVAAWIALQIANGLHAAHELVDEDGTPLGVVHRDVSPQNVLLSFEGRVLLADFGVAKLFEATRATASGVIKGKFGYMAPEQIRGETIDRRTDLFALGVVLHEMLTGRVLYADFPPAQATFRIACDPVPSARDVRGEVPEQLDAIVRTCLAKSKDDRFATALEVRDALRAFLRGEGSAVDEAEVAALVARHFQSEKGKLDDRIRAAIAERDEALTVPGAPPPSGDDGEGVAELGQPSQATKLTATTSPSVASRERAGWVVWALGGAAVIGAAAWGAVSLGVLGAADTAASRASAPPTTSATSSVPVTVAAPANEHGVSPTRAVETPSPSAAAGSASAPAGSASASEPQVATPSSARGTGAGVTGGKGAASPSGTPVAPSGTAPAPQPSHRGVPFRDL